MENIINASELIGQSLRFRQGGRVYLDGLVYRMDGTDGQARLMLLSDQVYNRLRRARNDGMEDRVHVSDLYVYVVGIPGNVLETGRP